MLSSVKLKRISKWVIWVGSLVLIMLLLFSYNSYSKIMTVGQFIIFATSLILLFISTTVLFTKPSHEKIKTPKLISKYFLLAIALLLFAFCLATMLEVTQFGYRWILSLSLFSFSLIIISIRNIVKPEGGNIYMLLLLFLLFFTFIYLIFPPSLGNDTWRDIIYASEITND